MFRPFAEWLSNTPVSLALQTTSWVIPTSQSLHIAALSVVFASALMINLRLLGIGKAGRGARQLTDTLAPWIWSGLVVLLITGTLQTIAEPVRQFVTPVFWAKMAMIIVVVLLTVIFVRVVRRHAGYWDGAQSVPRSAIAFAITSTMLWTAIIVCGRFIGYTWMFYV